MDNSILHNGLGVFNSPLLVCHVISWIINYMLLLASNNYLKYVSVLRGRGKRPEMELRLTGVPLPTARTFNFEPFNVDATTRLPRVLLPFGFFLFTFSPVAPVANIRVRNAVRFAIRRAGNNDDGRRRLARVSHAVQREYGGLFRHSGKTRRRAQPVPVGTCVTVTPGCLPARNLVSRRSRLTSDLSRSSRGDGPPNK